MSKFLVTAAQVVGAVVAVAAAIPTGGTSLLAYGLGVSATTASLIALATTVATTAISAIAAKKPSAGGNPFEWKADPDVGIDLVLGDAFNAGHIIYRQTYGKKNKYQTLVTNWSLGPVQSIDTLYVDNVSKGVAAELVDIEDRGKMYEARQLGLCPEPNALTCGLAYGLPMPNGWTAAHRLSGKAATATTFVYDTKGGKTFTSIPACGWRGKGLLCWDPRKDDTYPGGSGPQRRDDQSTWVWSNNPYVVGITYVIGWRQNGKLAGGVGADLEGVLLDQFVEGANVADLNGWRCGGVKSTTDDKWDTLKDILQAGGGEPVRLGAMLGCLVRTPRVSLATIDRHCLADGDIVVPACTARRDRINTIVPSYQNEQQVTTRDNDDNLITTTTWATVSGAPIIVDDYVTADGRQRRKAQSYPLVQCFYGDEPTQVAQLSRYDIEDAREFGPISLPLKLRWMGYKPGDVVTVDLPEAGLVNQDVLLLTRSLEPGTGVVTMTARSETAAKHAFALGQTTTAPPSPGVSATSFGVDAPSADAWTAIGGTISSSGGSMPALLIALSADADADELDGVDGILVEYRQSGDDTLPWISSGLDAATMTARQITSVSAGTSYQVAISYRSRGIYGSRLVLGPEVAGAWLTPSDIAQLIVNSKPESGWVPLSDLDASGTTATITITAHNRIYQDKTVAVSAGTITGLDLDTYYTLFYDDPDRAGGAETFLASTNTDDALPATTAHPGRHYLGFITTPAAGSTGSSSGGGASGGGGVGSKEQLR